MSSAVLVCGFNNSAVAPIGQCIQKPQRATDIGIVLVRVDGGTAAVIRANLFKMRQQFRLQRLGSGCPFTRVHGYVDLQPGGLKRATFVSMGSCSIALGY
jgi:hypothetical protein